MTASGAYNLLTDEDIERFTDITRVTVFSKGSLKYSHFRVVA